MATRQRHAMRMKRLGRTGLQVPIVGVGTAFIGYVPAAAWQDAGEVVIDTEAAAQTLEAALAAGSTMIDTAPLYGQTKVESVIGRVLAGRPGRADGLILCTKAGRLTGGHDYSRDAILASVSQSLERLQVDHLDVVCVHDSMEYFDDVMGPGGSLAALRELRDQDVIGAIGVGCADPGETARYVETGDFDVAVVANAWSLINHLLLQRILPAAQRYDVGLVIATPLERGLLAVGAGGGRVQGGRTHSDRVLDLVHRVEELCQRYQVPLLAVSLQWLTRIPQVAAAIPGPRTADEASTNAQAAMLPIPDELWTELDPILQEVAE
jgi:D-threo-aldose 1-dehydrogenase